jgi:hypothetical protein
MMPEAVQAEGVVAVILIPQPDVEAPPVQLVGSSQRADCSTEAHAPGGIRAGRPVGVTNHQRLHGRQFDACRNADPRNTAGCWRDGQHRQEDQAK